MGTLSMPIDEAAEIPKCFPGTSNTVSPFDISPVPNIKKRTTTRGRKATRSSLITGSPYKDQLTKSLEKSAPKSVPGKIRPTKRYDSSSDSSDYYDPPLVDSDDDINLDINDGDKPDSRKATCIFCDGKFSEDTRGEEQFSSFNTLAFVRLISVIFNGRGGLVARSRLWNRRVPGSKPDSTDDPSCMGPAARQIIRSGQTSSRWCGVAWKFGEGVPAQVSSSSSDRGSKLRGSSQNSPHVASKRDVNITKPSYLICCQIGM
ncbi:hypothetical protein AVEN_91518-1 [Araneus ventricosus]|uniref:Uncharacterized protein n=1 Tax=Araneus ventricosus TaxID=182803 RepID=A0A4Y2BK91_ARAVE|nr:hypothetical protein AVEN_91518-1 [Araneus ventricosus]